MKSLASSIVRHKKGVLATWIGLIVALAVGLAAFGVSFSDASDVPASESATALELMSSVQPSDVSMGRIVWKSQGTAVTDEAIKADVALMLDEVSKIDGVLSIASPYTEGTASQLNAAQDTAFAVVTTSDDVDIEAVRKVIESHDSDVLNVEMGGTALTATPGGQHGAEGIGLIAALILLYAIFRARRAALLPLLTGVVGVATSLMGVMLLSHVIGVPEDAITMGALIGLGVGIDYALFIVNRYRTALMSGKSVSTSVVEALNSSGRAVIFAGLTVIVALVGMFILGMPILTAMAIAAAGTVLMTILASITLLPALLAMLGIKALPRKHRSTVATGGVVPQQTGRIAGAWVTQVVKRPVLAIVASLVIVLTLAAPIVSMHISRADDSADPVGSPTRDYFDMITPAFGEGIDASVVLVGKTPDDDAAERFASLTSSLSSLDGVAAVQAVPSAPGQAISMAVLVPKTSAQTQESEELVNELRETVVPEYQDGSSLEVFVTGSTAANMDIASTLLGNLPIYLVVISLVGFVVLAAAFRSLVVPLLGVLTNLASIAVGIGSAVAIFQFGWGSSLFGVGGGAPIIYMVPVLVAGVMFGLAMDYQVFLVSRIHEEWTHGETHTVAIKRGVTDTAKVVATAALIMLSVFLSFAFSGDRIVAALGVGLAIAALLDAFVIRLTLIPALLKVIGARTWSYPNWAEAITPHVSIEGPSDNAPAGLESTEETSLALSGATGNRQ